MPKIALIAASTRTPRVGDDVTRWVQTVLAESLPTDITIEPVALADFNLPVFDEPIMPAMVPAYGSFTHDHTKRWTAAMASYDGYVWVIPEYNGGLAGATKNAIDYLFHELAGKPLGVVSYGIKGGARANEHLRWTCEKIFSMKAVPTFVELVFSGDDKNAAIAAGKVGEGSWQVWDGKEYKDKITKMMEEIGDVLLVGQTSTETSKA